MVGNEAGNEIKAVVGKGQRKWGMIRAFSMEK